MSNTQRKMDCGVLAQECAATGETQSLVTNSSTDQFQKSMLDLFEKNGILNDLRAYLRSHIVEILKNAQNGNLSTCQKHFTQRLESPSQALNMLIAEHLLCFDFNYSLSVFVSEIPLPNMVFGFAKSLMQHQDNQESSGLQFQDSDVWLILNYLGIQCDSAQADNVLRMYKTQKNTSLLQCIIKCGYLYQPQDLDVEQESCSTESSESLGNTKTVTAHKQVLSVNKCKHYAHCKTCLNKINRIKERYKKKKNNLKQHLKGKDAVPFENLEYLLRNIGAVERKIIDEMFLHVKTVYEAEVAMIKEEEENKVKRSEATHSLLLQKKCAAMEESLKAREDALERNMQLKKQFVWGLARSLREQHDTLLRAMRDVRAETDRLTAKETSLKTQLADAQLVLQKRSEEMRAQISQELTILEGHLHSMREERDNITKEKTELEKLRIEDINSTKIRRKEKDVQCHYDLVQQELNVLRMCIESLKITPKCVMERGTTTECFVSEMSKVTLNNSQNGERSRNEDLDERLKVNQVVNDFKKKNVNFDQNLDAMYQISREKYRSTSSIEAGTSVDAARGSDSVLQQLREENHRLKDVARQQGFYIAALAASPAPRVRPRSAPAPAPAPAPVPAPAPAPRLLRTMAASSVSTVSSRRRTGGGEELSVFSSAEPRVLVPGDTLPFIGVLPDRETTSKRPAMWRSIRARGISKRIASPVRERIGGGTMNLNMAFRNRRQANFDTSQQDHGSSSRGRQRSPKSHALNIERVKSPKSVLTEAKKRLRNMVEPKDTDEVPTREKSPNTVLREAKLRLRKLEIEAEAVEKSYMDFRRRHSDMKVDKSKTDKDKENIIINRNVGIRCQSYCKPEPTKRQLDEKVHFKSSFTQDLNRFLKNYKKADDITLHYRNKSPTEKPSTLIDGNNFNAIIEKENFLEKPLTEFRKLYHSDTPIQYDTSRNIESNRNATTSHEETPDSNRTSTSNVSKQKSKHPKEAELKILKQNIKKLYCIPDNINPSESTLNEEMNVEDITDKNLLRIEVESVELHDKEMGNSLLVVRSSVDQQVTIAERDSPGNNSNNNVIVANSITEAFQYKRSPENSTSSRKNVIVNAAYHVQVSHERDGPKSIVDGTPSSNLSRQSTNLEINKGYLDLLLEDNEGMNKQVLNDSREYKTTNDASDNDDFSADVDNYNNSATDYELHSPISMSKAPDVDHFWDS